jgi:hypothetical protein
LVEINISRSFHNLYPDVLVRIDGFGLTGKNFDMVNELLCMVTDIFYTFIIANTTGWTMPKFLPVKPKPSMRTRTSG